MEQEILFLIQNVGKAYGKNTKHKTKGERRQGVQCTKYTRVNGRGLADGKTVETTRE